MCNLTCRPRADGLRPPLALGVRPHPNRPSPMAKNNIDGYLRWITPAPGDPTYSLLKAHLLFEELLRTYLARTLPHASALEGSRLTFVQLLAVAKASSPHLKPDHWIWKAIGDLNKLRNMLSHETRPKAMAEKMDDYTKFIVQHTKVPLPEPDLGSQSSPSASSNKHLYSPADMVTIGLYYSAAGALGFDVKAIVDHESDALKRSAHVTEAEQSRGDAA